MLQMIITTANIPYKSSFEEFSAINAKITIGRDSKIALPI